MSGQTFDYNPSASAGASGYTDQQTIFVENTTVDNIPTEAFYVNAPATPKIPSGLGYPVALTFQKDVPAGALSMKTIGNSAFKRCPGLTSVTLPSSITTIIDGAFADSSIETLIIEPSGGSGDLNFIGSSAFSGNDGMTVYINKFSPFASGSSIIVPSQNVNFFGATGVTILNYPNTFEYKPGTTLSSDYNGENTIKVMNSPGTNIPANAFLELITAAMAPVELVFESVSTTKIINDNAFKDCPGLTSVIFPSSLTIISPASFELSFTPAPGKGLSSVTFTDIANSQLNSIGMKAFFGQKNLTSIILPKSLKAIRTQAFYDTGLTTLTFDDIANSQLEEIKSNVPSSPEASSAFQGTSLTSVTLPASLKLIGNYAFSISGLTSVTFFDIALSRLDTIYAAAFSSASLSTITIPNHVTSIGQDAFTGSTGMTVYINSKVANTLDIIGPFPKLNAIFYGATGVTINTDPDTYEYTPGSSDPSTEYTGEQTILVNNSPGKIIPGSAFLGLITAGYAPVALVFANGSTTQSISYLAFEACPGLKSVTIPDSITSIESNAFFDCGLQTVYISKKTAATLGIPVPSQNVPFFGTTVTTVEYPVVTPPPPVIIFPYPKNEKNKRLLGVNQKISSGLARPNFRFQTNQFSAGRSRTAQSKQKANGPVTVIFPIR
jgi:hypothetical protein